MPTRLACPQAWFTVPRNCYQQYRHSSADATVDLHHVQPKSQKQVLVGRSRSSSENPTWMVESPWACQANHPILAPLASLRQVVPGRRVHRRRCRRAPTVIMVACRANGGCTHFNLTNGCAHGVQSRGVQGELSVCAYSVEQTVLDAVAHGESNKGPASPRTTKAPKHGTIKTTNKPTKAHPNSHRTTLQTCAPNIRRTTQLDAAAHAFTVQVKASHLAVKLHHTHSILLSELPQ